MVDQRMTKDAAKRQIAAADKRIKGISSIASNTVKRAKMLEIEKQYGTTTGNKQAVTSVDKALRSLSKSTDALAHGVKLITVETARGVKSITTTGAKAMNEYAKAISEDIHINRQNFMVTTIGKFTPLVGYAVAKMMETSVFRNMIEKMKAGLNRALNSVTSKFKKLAMAGWDKGKDLWDSFRDKISGKRGAVNTRMAKARAAKKEKRYHTQDAAIKAALSDAKVASAIRKSSNKNDLESQIPHMATGGFVKKEGIAKIHAAEVVQPIDKLIETIVKSVTETIERKEKKPKSTGFGTFFEKAKEKDLFGFAKVSDTINTAFDIMTKRNMALETRVMKRDKANRKGIFKSFFEAYAHESKQEEIPLMERQVRATLELKNTISGENKTLRTAITKVLYEHPMFHAFILLNKGFGKLTTLPFKFFFKKRGKSTYSSQLTKTGTVFEQMANTSALTYSTMMLKLDDIIANTYIAAQSTAGVMSATQGATQPKNIGARNAPQQKAVWSIAGSIYKTLVKKPADYIKDFMREVDPDSRKTRWGTANISPKAAIKAVKRMQAEKKEKKLQERTERRAVAREANEKVNALYKKAAENKKLEKQKRRAQAKIRTQLEIEEKDRIREIQTQSRRSILQHQKYIKEEDKKNREKRGPSPSFSDRDEYQEALGPVRERAANAKAQRIQMEAEKKAARDKKKASFISKIQDEGTGNKDRMGRKTVAGSLREIARNTKDTVKATNKGTSASGSWFAKMKDWGMLLVTGIFGLASKLKAIPETLLKLFLGKKVGGFLSDLLVKAVKSIGVLLFGKKIASEAGETAAKQAAKTASKKAADVVAKKSLGKAGGKFLAKTMLKKIPVAGLLIGLGLAAKRLASGDFSGAAMEAASGAASTIPGLGTGASFGIDAMLLAKDLKKSGKTSLESTPAKIDVIKATNQKKKKDFVKQENKATINKYQGMVADWLPIAGAFTGSASGTLIANYMSGKLKENPEVLSKQADSIVKLGWTGWSAYGGDIQSFKMAQTIVDEKNSFMTAYKRGMSGQVDAATSHHDPSRKEMTMQSVAESAGRKTKEIKDKADPHLNRLKGVVNAFGMSSDQRQMIKDSGGKQNADYTSIMALFQKSLIASNNAKNTSIDFLQDVYKNPKEYYKNTKELVWGGITDLNKKISESNITLASIKDSFSSGVTTVNERLLASNINLNEIYKIAKDEAEYLSVVRGLKGAQYRNLDGGSLSYQESMLKKGPSKHDVAVAGAKRDVGLAEMTTNAFDRGLTGVKDVVEKGSKHTTAMINNVMQQSTKIMSSNTNNSGGGDSYQQRPIEIFTQKVLQGEIG